MGAALKGDAAACVALHEQFLVVGFASGEVLVVDVHGRELARWRPHGRSVNAISVDAGGQYIATCSDDGNVAIRPAPDS